MASYQFVNSSDQVRDSFSAVVRHGRSKAQMCLQKILDLISSQSQTSGSSFNPRFGKLGIRTEKNGDSLCRIRGFEIDLNHQLVIEEGAEVSGGGDCDVCEAEKSDLVMSTSEKSSVGECDLKDDTENLNGSDSSENKDQGRARKFVVNENPRVQNSEIDKNVEVSAEAKIESLEKKNVSRGLRGEDCLAMLIEAAELISGASADEVSEPDKPSQTGVLTRSEFIKDEHNHRLAERRADTRQGKRSHCRGADADGEDEGPSPVVRSKRGRSQVLPCRFRDSVLEPLARLSRQKSTSLSTRRRSR